MFCVGWSCRPQGRTYPNLLMVMLLSHKAQINYYWSPERTSQLCTDEVFMIYSCTFAYTFFKAFRLICIIYHISFAERLMTLRSTETWHSFTELNNILKINNWTSRLGALVLRGVPWMLWFCILDTAVLLKIELEETKTLLHWIFIRQFLWLGTTGCRAVTQ